MSRDFEITEDTFLTKWGVEPYDEGQRLDHFLKQKYRKLSREYLKKFIRDGRVQLNYKITKPSRILKNQDKVYVLTVRGKEPEVDLAYTVIYEDDTLLIINKPGNLPVHPTGRFFFNTLLTRLRIVGKNEIDQDKKFYIVHRLDRETSGVLAIGKTKEGCANLVDQFFERQPKKEYLAIVCGRMTKDEYIVEAPLRKDPYARIRLKMHTIDVGSSSLEEMNALPAKTIFRVEKRFSNYTLVRAIPHTGRQHQIRVHLDHLGYPIAGDKLYGNSNEELFLQNRHTPMKIEVEPGIFLHRQALHATKLSLRHPKTDEWMEFETDIPEDMASFLEKVN